MIEEAKRNYFRKAGNTLADPGTNSKTYWNLINTVLNKAKIPLIPPLLENGLFVTDFTEKAQIFNDYFILQCTTIDTGSEFPQGTPATTTLLTDFVISEEKIINIIRSLNPNKAHGWDEIKIGGASANSDWSSSSLPVASRSLCLHSLLLSDRRSLPIT